MILYLPVVICLLTAVVNFSIGLIKRPARILGFVNLFSAILLWGLVVSSVLIIPSNSEIQILEIPGLPSLLFQFQLDLTSWAIGAAISSILLIAVLTTSLSDRIYQAGNFLLGGAGLASIMSTNPITLVIWWTVIDLVELLVYFLMINSSIQRERIVYNFAVRLSGTFVILISSLIINPPQGLSVLSSGSTFAGLFTFLACYLRLGAVPFATPSFAHPDLRRGTGTLLTLVPAASAVMLLTRFNAPIFPDGWKTIFFVIVFIIGFASSIVWLMEEDLAKSRPYWITGVAALIFASAMNGLPEASTTWSLLLLMGASPIFMLSIQGKLSRWWLTTFTIFLAGLPFTPNWPGMRLFSLPGSLQNLLFLFPFTILILGVFKNSWKKASEGDAVQRKLSSANFLMIGFLTVFYMILGLVLILSWKYSGQLWTGLLVVLLCTGAIFISRRVNIRIPFRFSIGWREISSLGWVYKTGGLLYRSVEQATSLFSRLIEGESGTLWSLLLLVALLSLLTSLIR